MKKMDNIATDKDIISYVKNQFFANEISDYIIFYVRLKKDRDISAMWGFGYVNIDGLVTKLFDLSLTSRIRSIDAMTDWKGRLCAFEVVVEKSPDHQTNITGNLVDLFSILADPNGIERLKPAKTSSCNAIDLWEQMEAE